MGFMHVHFYRIWNWAKPWPMTNGIWQSLGLDLVIVSVYENFIKIFHTVQEIGQFSLFQTLDLSKASTDYKWHLAIPWARSYQYQCVCKILSKYSIWLKSYGQFSLTDHGRTYNFTNWLRMDTQTGNGQITKKLTEQEFFILTYDTLFDESTFEVSLSNLVQFKRYGQFSQTDWRQTRFTNWLGTDTRRL